MIDQIRPAAAQHVPSLLALVNRFAAQNIMLPRTEEGIRRSLPDWLVVADETQGDAVVGCGCLVALTPTLVEVRSLAVAESRQGTGLGGRLVTALVDEARIRGYEQVCALTLRPAFFERLGFAVVDRWSISPKVWQACIYCPKFHRCDEVAMLMDLTEVHGAGEDDDRGSAGWNRLLKYGAWQPLKLAYQKKPEKRDG
ncbi:MAG: GNAT family N-acetyltransferase [Caldilineaceae bacterium]|nr:GNAT family N-acetyltransferase [Caldilineaceae bacterium]